MEFYHFRIKRYVYRETNITFIQSRLFRGHVVDPPPTKKVDFFQTKCNVILSMPWKPLFIKTIFLYCLSTGTKEIFIKKGDKTFRGFRGVRDKGTCSPQFLFYRRPPLLLIALNSNKIITEMSPKVVVHYVLEMFRDILLY